MSEKKYKGLMDYFVQKCLLCRLRVMHCLSCFICFVAVRVIEMQVLLFCEHVELNHVYVLLSVALCMYKWMCTVMLYCI